jgi:predicted alpha/beta superfamily hydrolase
LDRNNEAENFKHSHLTIILTTDEDDGRPVFISGNFNEWQTQDGRFQMSRVSHGSYSFSFPTDFIFPEELLYKFTRGDWSEVEIDRFGNRTENRICRKFTGIRREHVEKWRHNWLPFRQELLPQIHLLSDVFEMPQLNKKRRIWALLPYDYDSSDQHYPVLYLHDAQNLFNQESPFGNWEIDKKLAVMSQYNIGRIIIIAVEHGGEDRIKEYNVGRTVLGKGQGKKYIRFVTDTLKPYVDSKFRTLPQREYTGIGGSSMGALVSIFTGLIYPEVYGRLMIFSPSLWVVNADEFPAADYEDVDETRIYLYAGGNESESMLRHVRKFKHSLTQNHLLTSRIKIKTSINMLGRHTETFWSDEFPKAVEWLFFSNKEE